MKELVVEARLECLNDVISFVNEELERNHCPPEPQGSIVLAVEEIFVNIAHYAYQPGSGSAAINITVSEEAVIKFEDTGRAYNPLERPDPDVNLPIMEREIGGLGIFIVKTIMDKVDYMRQDNKNVLILTKKIK